MIKALFALAVSFSFTAHADLDQEYQQRSAEQKQAAEQAADQRDFNFGYQLCVRAIRKKSRSVIEDSQIKDFGNGFNYSLIATTRNQRICRCPFSKAPLVVLNAIEDDTHCAAR